MSGYRAPVVFLGGVRCVIRRAVAMRGAGLRACACFLAAAMRGGGGGVVEVEVVRSCALGGALRLDRLAAAGVRMRG